MNELALVNHEVVRWARQRLGMEVSAVASKLGVTSGTASAWETGSTRPTFKQAQRLAKTLMVPFGHLFLSAPPVDDDDIDTQLPIGRTASQWKPSRELIDLFDDARFKQEWFKDYRKAQGADSLPFVGRFPSNLITVDAGELAGDIVRTISRLSLSESIARHSGNSLLRELTSNAEESGIMVMRSGVVGNNVHRPLSSKEFRGFALPDTIAPLIFINARKNVPDQLTTLFHEMAHIWMMEERVCESPPVDSPDSPDHSGPHGISQIRMVEPSDRIDPAERFCDEVATQSLAMALSGTQPRTEPPGVVDSRYFEVFSADLEHIDLEVNDALPSMRFENSGGGENAEHGNLFCRMLVTRNGMAFTKAVISSAAEGNLLSRDAADLLGIRVKTLSSVAQHLHGNPLNFG